MRSKDRTMSSSLAQGYDTLRAARPVLATAPTLEPVSLNDALTHLRLTSDESDTDATVNRLIQVVREQVETDTGRALCTQTWDAYWDDVPSGDLWLPKPRLISVTSVTSYNDAGTAAVLAATNYQVVTSSEPGRLVLTSTGAWPSDVRDADAFVARYVCGYGLPTAVPAPLKLAMFMLLGSLYEHREEVIVSQFAGQLITIPYGYHQLIAPYKVLWVG
jgi:uncharacterized phiE125 gp8 family phage protein